MTSGWQNLLLAFQTTSKASINPSSKQFATRLLMVVDAKPQPNLPLVERVGAAIKQAGITEFNKGRVAKRIMDDLAKKKISDLPTTTVNNFTKVITAINSIVQGWRKK